jgi:hypothetical protein
MGCGDEPTVPSEPADLSQWCDFERPREDCTLDDALLIEEISDIEQVCSSPCTHARNLSFLNDGTRALGGMQGFVEVERLVVSTPDNGPTNLEGLEDLERVSGFLDLSSNRSLQNLEGLNNLKSVGNPDTNSGLLLVDSSVSSLDGLESLEWLQALEISNSPIDSLAPLEGVEIREGLGITFTEIGSVAGMTFDDTELRAVDISNNDELISIPALEGVRSVSGGVVFQSNPKLSRCDIDKFVDGLETKPSAEWIRISGNMPCEP